MIADITDTQEEIKIGAEGLTEIFQNVRTIIRTVKGTVPLDRAFGLDIDFLDNPIPVARAKYAAEVVRAINEHEPRAEVVKVIWSDDGPELMDGKDRPTVRIKIKDGTEL